MIYCCKCEKKVEARLTDGSEIYPHRLDLWEIPFWKCDTCANYVGCHHKTTNPTNPLGNIPTPEIRKARSHIHALIDPLWKSGRFHRRNVYAMIAEKLGIKSYHTANIKSVEEAREVYRIAQDIINNSAEAA